MKTINSWEDLQENVTEIIKLLEKDENFTSAAAANPLFAIEELGYEINPQVREQLEDRMRFNTKNVAKLSKLRDSIFKIAGKRIDIRSSKELSALLFDDLNLVAYDTRGCPVEPVNLTNTGYRSNEDDVIMLYEGLHPIIKPLLDFRKIDSSVSGFCSKDNYNNIRIGKKYSPFDIRLKIRLKKTKN